MSNSSSPSPSQNIDHLAVMTSRVWRAPLRRTVLLGKPRPITSSRSTQTVPWSRRSSRHRLPKPPDTQQHPPYLDGRYSSPALSLPIPDEHGRLERDPVLRRRDPERLLRRLRLEVRHVRVLVVPLEAAPDEQALRGERDVLVPVPHDHDVVRLAGRRLPARLPVRPEHQRGERPGDPGPSPELVAVRQEELRVVDLDVCVIGLRDLQRDPRVPRHLALHQAVEEPVEVVGRALLRDRLPRHPPVVPRDGRDVHPPELVREHPDHRLHRADPVEQRPEQRVRVRPRELLVDVPREDVAPEEDPEAPVPNAAEERPRGLDGLLGPPPDPRLPILRLLALLGRLGLDPLDDPELLPELLQLLLGDGQLRLEARRFPLRLVGLGPELLDLNVRRVTVHQSLSFRRFISDSQCTHRVRRCRLTDSSFFVYPCLCRTLIVPVIGSVGSNTIAASATASSLLSLLLSSRNFDIWHLKPTDSFISRRTSALRPSTVIISPPSPCV